MVPELPPARVCPWQPGDNLSATQRRQARADPRCQDRAVDYYGNYVETLVDDGTALPLLTGADPSATADAAAVLRSGGVVVTDPRYLQDGRVTVQVNRVRDRAGRADRHRRRAARRTRCRRRSASPACCCPRPRPDASP